MKIMRITLMSFLLCAMSCIGAEMHDNMWIRFKEKGVPLDVEALGLFTSKAITKVGKEKCRAIVAHADEWQPTYALFIGIHSCSPFFGGVKVKFNDLIEKCRNELDILSSYTVSKVYTLFECIPMIKPEFALERRMEAVLTILSIYAALGLDPNEKEYLIRDLEHEIENRLKNINPTHMIIPREGEQDFEIVS